MSRKRARDNVVLYDHSKTRNRATASTFDFNFAKRRLKLDQRVVEVVPKVDNHPHQVLYPTYTAAANDIEEIRHEETGIVVKATMRAKRYLNSVSGCHRPITRIFNTNISRRTRR